MLKSGTGMGAVILVVNTTSLGLHTDPFFLLAVQEMYVYLK